MCPFPVEWYDAPGGNLLATGLTYTTQSLTQTTTFYTQSGSGSCLSSVIPVNAVVKCDYSGSCCDRWVDVEMVGNSDCDWHCSSKLVYFSKWWISDQYRSNVFDTILVAVDNFLCSSRNDLSKSDSAGRSNDKCCFTCAGCFRYHTLWKCFCHTHRNRYSFGVLVQCCNWRNNISDRINYTTPVLNQSTTYYVQAGGFVQVRLFLSLWVCIRLLQILWESMVRFMDLDL